MASGHKKAEAIRKCIEEGINHMCPASILQLHPKVKIICDKEVASNLKTRTVNYFKELQTKIDVMGNTVINNINSFIKPHEKVIIFSPHPDDDVIGMGGTMQLLKHKQNVTIVYIQVAKVVYQHIYQKIQEKKKQH